MSRATKRGGVGEGHQGSDSLRLSWSLSDSTPPHTMAPRRPFPIGAASVKYLAGDANTTFSGRASWSAVGHPTAEATASASGGRLTQTHSVPASHSPLPSIFFLRHGVRDKHGAGVRSVVCAGPT
jgi:hypothetical protein